MTDRMKVVGRLSKTKQFIEKRLLLMIYNFVRTRQSHGKSQVSHTTQASPQPMSLPEGLCTQLKYYQIMQKSGVKRE